MHIFLYNLCTNYVHYLSVLFYAYLAHNAGLEGVSLCAEPTAGVIAYVVSEKKKFDEMVLSQEENFIEHVFLVIDCGGGTTDFSKLAVEGSAVNKNVKYSFVNKKTTGVEYLGGQDFTTGIYQRLFDQFTKEHKINLEEYELSHKMDLEKKIRDIAEKMKKRINNAAQVTQDFVWCLKKYTFKINQMEVSEWMKPYLKNFTEQMELCIEEDVIDSVLLIGGSSDCFFIKKLVEKYFGKQPINTSNSRDLVAEGSAYVSFMSNNPDSSVFQFNTISGFDIGIKKYPDLLDIIIPRGVSIPFEKTYTKYTNPARCDHMTCTVFEGNNPTASLNNQLGTIKLNLKKHFEPHEARLSVKASVDANGQVVITSWLQTDTSVIGTFEWKNQMEISTKSTTVEEEEKKIDDTQNIENTKQNCICTIEKLSDLNYPIEKLQELQQKFTAINSLNEWREFFIHVEHIHQQFTTVGHQREAPPTNPGEESPAKKQKK